MKNSVKKTHSVSATGHDKNVANFEKLKGNCIGYAAKFNPSRTALKVPAQETMFTNATAVVLAVLLAFPAYNNARTARRVAYKPASKYLTRVMSYVESLDISQELKDNVRTIIRKLQGKRASALLTEEQLKELAAMGKETKQISSSQMDFDSRLGIFNKLIKLLASIPEYAPNEVELSITALNFLYNDLKTKNTAVITTMAAWNNAIIARDKVLYEDNTGLVDIAQDVKAYIKAVFGATSVEYKQVSKLRFIKFNYH